MSDKTNTTTKIENQPIPLDLSGIIPTKAPAGDLSKYEGASLIEETIYRTADGKMIIHRQHVAGMRPAGQPEFWFHATIGVRTPQGVAKVPLEGPLMVKTLAEALQSYDVAVESAGKAYMADLEAQMRRASLSVPPGANVSQIIKP